MSIARTVFGWGKANTSERAQRAGTTERYPSEVCVTLPGGQLMYVRNASLAAAKDLLAAQRAAERRIAAQRAARVMRDAVDVVEREHAQRGY